MSLAKKCDRCGKLYLHNFNRKDFKDFNGVAKVWEEKKEPFIVLEIETEEDYNKLRKAVKQYQKQDNRGWIKAEDKLPDDSDCVLVLASGNVGEVILIEAYMLAEYYKDEGFILEQYPAAEDIIIEWWMPLPEPPEGVKI